MHDTRRKISEFLEKDVLTTTQDASSIDNLVTGGNIDSFDMVKLMMFLENEFKIKISQEDLTEESFNSVAAMAKMIERKLA